MVIFTLVSRGIMLDLFARERFLRARVNSPALAAQRLEMAAWEARSRAERCCRCAVAVAASPNTNARMADGACMVDDWRM